MEALERDDAASIDGARPRARSFEHWFILAAALGAIALVGILALAIEPDPRGYGTHEQLGLPSCKMLELTGYPCPGCGVTTSVALAARGRFLESIANHPFGFLTALAIPAFAAWAVYQHFRGRDLYQRASAVRFGRVGFFLVCFMLAAWIYKCAVLHGWIAKLA